VLPRRVHVRSLWAPVYTLFFLSLVRLCLFSLGYLCGHLGGDPPAVLSRRMHVSDTIPYN